MDKIIFTRRCLKDTDNVISRGQLMADLEQAGRNPGKQFQEILLTGAVNSVADFSHVHPWWNPQLKTMDIFWWTTDTQACLEKFNILHTDELIKNATKMGWEAQVPPTVIKDNTPGNKKQIMLEKLYLLEHTNLVIDNSGTLIKKSDRVEFWTPDGAVSILCNSLIDHWLWSYMIKKHGHISLNHGIQEWCEHIDHPAYMLYHEIIPPNNEPGISFSNDIKDKVLDDNYIKEFIDQVNYMCPHMKRMRPDYNKWPTTPVTFEDRFRDSYGYYFMYYTEWHLSSEEWETMQLSYLENFLDNRQYSGDRNKIIEYAQQKWKIDYYLDKE